MPKMSGYSTVTEQLSPSLQYQEAKGGGGGGGWEAFIWTQQLQFQAMLRALRSSVRVKQNGRCFNLGGLRPSGFHCSPMLPQFLALSLSLSHIMLSYMYTYIKSKLRRPRSCLIKYSTADESSSSIWIVSCRLWNCLELTLPNGILSKFARKTWIN